MKSKLLECETVLPVTTEFPPSHPNMSFRRFVQVASLAHCKEDPHENGYPNRMHAIKARQGRKLTTYQDFVYPCLCHLYEELSIVILTGSRRF